MTVTFHPTHEWQHFPEGAVAPTGCEFGIDPNNPAVRQARIAPNGGHAAGLEDLDRQYEQEAAIAAGLRRKKDLVFNPKDPLPIAQAFVAMDYQQDAGRTLHHHRREFYVWTGTCYAEMSETELRAPVVRHARRGKALRPERTGVEAFPA
jgi:hypothetical protein